MSDEKVVEPAPVSPTGMSPAGTGLPTGVRRRRPPSAGDAYPSIAAEPDRGPLLDDESGGAEPLPPEPASLLVSEAGTEGINTDLLSNFTHQIINPLNGVVGTLDNIIDGSISADRRLQRLRAIRAQLVGSIELVRNLAYLSQLSTKTGQEGLREKAVDVVLPRLIIEAAQFYQESAEQRSILIRLTDEVTQYIVKGHAALLRQVFMNLFDNAVKYSDADSRIEVLPHPQRHTGHLLVEVKNVGPGFDASERERIFDLGYRSQEARRVRASGSGIGLFICRQILGLHDATIEAECSREQRTVTLRIRFPQHRIAEPRMKEDGDAER